jgi:hypothetical protein
MARIVNLPAVSDGEQTETEDDDALAPPVALDGDQLVIRGLLVRGAPAEAVRHCVEQGDDAEDTVRQMLDIGGMVLQHGASSTIAQAVIAEIRSDGITQEAIRAVADRVAAKGLVYEEQVHPVLESAFAGHGDIVEATGGTPGLDGKNKKGDFVVTLNPETLGGRDRRVVIEAKDRPSQKLSGKTGALTYLTEAMENRAADAGILVCSTAVPALAGHRLRVYAGNRILARYDKDEGDTLALEIACQLGRAFAARAQGAEDDLSVTLLAAKVERLREVIEQARAIHGGVLEAKRGIRRVDEAYETMRREALAVIHELEDRLAESYDTETRPRSHPARWMSSARSCSISEWRRTNSLTARRSTTLPVAFQWTWTRTACVAGCVATGSGRWVRICAALTIGAPWTTARPSA